MKYQKSADTILANWIYTICEGLKKIKTKHDNLVKLGIENYKAWEVANSRNSYWRISDTPILHIALNNKTLERLGYTSLSSAYC